MGLPFFQARTPRLGRLPVVVVTGYLTAGKTTFLDETLKELTEANPRLRYAVIALENKNQVDESSRDPASLARGNANGNQVEVVKIVSPSIEETPQAKLLLEVARIAASRDFDCLFIEGGWACDPLGIEEIFQQESDILSAQQHQQQYLEVISANLFAYTLVSNPAFTSRYPRIH